MMQKYSLLIENFIDDDGVVENGDSDSDGDDNNDGDDDGDVDGDGDGDGDGNSDGDGDGDGMIATPTLEVRSRKTSNFSSK